MYPHVVFTNGRSGSNFLVESLNQHAQLCNYGEVLGSYMPSRKLHDKLGYGGRTVEAYLDFVLRSKLHYRLAQGYSAVSRRRQGLPGRYKKWADLKSVGVKDFGIRFETDDLGDFFRDRPQIRVISLVRDNTLRRAVSITALRATGTVAVSQAGSAEAAALSVSVPEFMARMDALEKEKHEQLAMVEALQPGQWIHLTYEDLFSSAAARDSHMDEIFRFLGVAPITITERFHKIVSNDLAAAIENWDEVREAIAASPHARYLDSPTQPESTQPEPQSTPAKTSPSPLAPTEA